MKKSIKIETIEINDISIDLKEILQNASNVLVKFNHSFTNTFIDLSKLSNIELFFLDETGYELNRMRIQEKSSGPFFLLTQARIIKVKTFKSK